LQGLREIDGCSVDGVAASAAVAPKPGAWIEAPLRGNWIADPLALDCGFQLVILWSFEQLGGASLPTRLGEYRQYRAFPAERVHIRARVGKHSEHGANADIEWLDDDGALIAQLRGYECVIDASLSQAFKQNQLRSQPATRA
jgi:hypothetical protein